MKTKFFKIGSLRFYSIMTNKEMSETQQYLFITDFKDKANAYLKTFGIFEHYRDLDLRLYISNSRSTPFEDRIMKGIKDFETKCLVLGLVDHIKRAKPDITNISRLISLINHPERTIKAAVKAAILNEFCTVETT